MVSDQRRAEIALRAVRKHRCDHLVLAVLCGHLLCGPDIRAGRGSHEKSLNACQLSCGVDGILVRHLNDIRDDARIKDLRTGVECRDTTKVLNGDLDQFIEASLKSGL